MLSAPLDILRIRQYFNAVTMSLEVARGVRDDVTFVDAMRHALFPLPFEHRGTRERHPFPPLHRVSPGALAGRRVAVASTGGSGALASLVGIARALEEAGVRPSMYSVCSGASLFGFPLAAGLSADEVAVQVLSMRAQEMVDVDWPGVLAIGPRRARGFSGFMRGERIEQAYERMLGRMTLADLAVPCYAPVWNVERNRLEFVGPRTHPRLRVSRAVRMAVSLPLFFQACAMGHDHYYDGGTVDVFPVAPVLDLEPRPDVVVAINGFYPHAFEGEDVTGWLQRTFSILYGASQVRTAAHMEVARRNYLRLRAEVPLVLLQEPVPYETICGTGLYRQYVDNSSWPAFMRAGRESMRRALHAAPATSGSPRRRPRPRLRRAATATPSRTRRPSPAPTATA